MKYREVRSRKDQPKIDLNKATFEELVRLPGIGPVIAKRIIEYRQRYGRFREIDDLVFKVGLGQSLVDKLGNWLKV